MTDIVLPGTHYTLDPGKSLKITYPNHVISKTIVNFGFKVGSITATDICRSDGIGFITMQIPFKECRGSHTGATVKLNIYSPDSKITRITSVIQSI